jgi:hypothetical protein
VRAITDRPRTRAPSLGPDPDAPGAWLLVVARGHAGLVTELEAVFRDDARVRVIENRRDGSALLPRPDVLSRPPIAGA